MSPAIIVQTSNISTANNPKQNKPAGFDKTSLKNSSTCQNKLVSSIAYLFNISVSQDIFLNKIVAEIYNIKSL